MSAQQHSHRGDMDNNISHRDTQELKIHISEACKHMEKRLDTVEHDLHGNGREGLLSDVSAMKVQLGVLNTMLSSMSPRVSQLERNVYIGIGALAAFQLLLKMI